MVESMATGTPVIAYGAGSVSEVVTHGVTGYVCETVREMIDAVPLAASIDRSACRAAVEQQFSVQAMADGYERAYWRVLTENGSNLSAVGPPTHSYEPASAAR
jgi:glycosyltransferase involved in cell wall biosynthesis